MKLLKFSGLFLASLLSLFLILAAHYYIRGFWKAAQDDHRVDTRRDSGEEKSRIMAKAAEMRKFLQGKKYNQEICFLVDMKLASGTSRFFVYDLPGDHVLFSGLVAHGSCGRNFSLSPSFSNMVGSRCTSLGKYFIGKSYQGTFGKAYKLYGLDSSNDNAFKRNIVLHAFSYVPEWETDPYPICNSSGCPMVAEGFLKKLGPILEWSKTPVILWIFN